LYLEDFQIPPEKTVETTVQSNFNNNTRNLPIADAEWSQSAKWPSAASKANS